MGALIFYILLLVSWNFSWAHLWMYIFIKKFLGLCSLYSAPNVSLCSPLMRRLFQNYGDIFFYRSYKVLFLPKCIIFEKRPEYSRNLSYFGHNILLVTWNWAYFTPLERPWNSLPLCYLECFLIPYRFFVAGILATNMFPRPFQSSKVHPILSNEQNIMLKIWKIPIIFCSFFK